MKINYRVSTAQFQYSTPSSNYHNYLLTSFRTLIRHTVRRRNRGIASPKGSLQRIKLFKSGYLDNLETPECLVVRSLGFPLSCSFVSRSFALSRFLRLYLSCSRLPFFRFLISHSTLSPAPSSSRLRVPVFSTPTGCSLAPRFLAHRASTSSGSLRLAPLPRTEPSHWLAPPCGLSPLHSRAGRRRRGRGGSLFFSYKYSDGASSYHSSLQSSTSTDLLLALAPAPDPAFGKTRPSSGLLLLCPTTHNQWLYTLSRLFLCWVPILCCLLTPPLDRDFSTGI